MEARELRSGNLLYGIYENIGVEANQETTEKRKDIVKFIGYDPWQNFLWVEGTINAEFYEEFEPIPLTEERLVRFGFTGTEFVMAYGNFLYFTDSKIMTWNGVILHHSIWNEVHKFQNLYFALKGQELTFDEKTT